MNGRVGYNLGDYGALGDNEMPCFACEYGFGMVATMNHNLGIQKERPKLEEPERYSLLIDRMCESWSELYGEYRSEGGWNPYHNRALI